MDRLTNRIALATIACLCLLIASSPGLADPATCRKDLEITGLPSGGAGFFANADSKITTYRGAIYCAYLDADLNVRVRRQSSDGAISDAYVFGPVANDPWHMAPVIGIDGRGYVHITGAMHDSHEWQYYISSAPESIDEFARQEHGSPHCPPGWLITYPEFARDNDGYLHLSSRQGTKNPGFLGGCIARYDHEARTWTSLGTDVDRWSYVIWFQKGPDEVRCYQRWQTKMHFDGANTLHVAWKVKALPPRTGTGNGTHIMYAALRDGETQWRTAAGDPIAELPLTIHNATIVATDLDRPELSLYGVGATASGAPIVNFWYTRGDAPGGGDKGRVVKWSGDAWERCVFPRDVVIPTFVMSDTRGGLFTHGPGGSTGYVSVDDGETWQVVAMPYDRGGALNQSFDRDHFVATGNPRFAAFFADEGAIEVWTILLDPQ